MSFHLKCACGATTVVGLGSAGATISCLCGRPLTVPDHVPLEHAPLEPDFVVEQLLAAGKLPQETACAVCATPTDAVVYCWVGCERAVVRTGRSFREWLENVLLFLIWWPFLIFRLLHPPQATEYGRDRDYRLPLRLCVGCTEGLTTEPAVKSALGRVELYRRLLEKYPKAKAYLEKQ